MCNTNQYSYLREQLGDIHLEKCQFRKFHGSNVHMVHIVPCCLGVTHFPQWMHNSDIVLVSEIIDSVENLKNI